MMIFPEVIECKKHWGRQDPCPGRAYRLHNSPMKLENDRGPWYGCQTCGCVAQYQDFKGHEDEQKGGAPNQPQS